MSGPAMQSVKIDYDRDGYVKVPGLFDPGQMLQWKSALQQALAAEAFKDPSGVRVWFNRALPQPVLDGMASRPMVEVLEALIGPDIEYLSAKAVFKDGKTSYGSPWHQDWFYWKGATKISVWVALDDATIENGCLTVVPGTHTRVFRNQVFGEVGFVNRVKEEDLNGLKVESAAIQRGDAIFFHDLLVHGSHPNRVGGDRWSIIATYRSGAVRDESDIWKSAWLLRGRSVNGATP